MRKQCVPGAPLLLLLFLFYFYFYFYFLFLRALGTRLAWEVYADRWQGRIPTANTYYTTLHETTVFM